MFMYNNQQYKKYNNLGNWTKHKQTKKNTNT